jgi:hypothetical protein
MMEKQFIDSAEILTITIWSVKAAGIRLRLKVEL